MKQDNHVVDLYTVEGEALMRDENRVPWDVYPRPHLERDSFLCLNGWWEFAVVEGSAAPDYRERIRVPFVPESKLSGIGRAMPKGAKLCYRRSFALEKTFVCERVILHFGAADQIAEVYLNGKLIGGHVGGYEHFSFDITDCLQDENVLEVFVTDELENHVLPYGKQCERRGGMWYTPVSGIWQTVWIESVPRVYVREVQIQTDKTGADLSLDLVGDCKRGEVVLICDDADAFFPIEDGKARIDVPDPIYWSPEKPHLYSIVIKVGEDIVRSYFALRTLEVSEINGTKRICLNGKPYFFHGLLDQGYFSDGIFLPATPNGYKNDVLTAKKFGFNMLRKHIKVEPETFYYACDRLGMVVFQDMVNNGDYSFFRDTALPTIGVKRLSDKRMHRDPKTREAFLAGMEQTARQLAHHPSICYWTIFNEGWGQFDHASAYERLKSIDDSRIIDSTSGWFSPLCRKKTTSDVESLHVYFKPVKIKVANNPIVLSEFGGYSYKVEKNTYNLKDNYGYRTFKEQNAFEDAVESLYIGEICSAIQKGLCATVYTQLSDVEDETNGIVTYDRKVEKVSEKRMKQMAKTLFTTFAKEVGRSI